VSDRPGEVHVQVLLHFETGERALILVLGLDDRARGPVARPRERDVLASGDLDVGSAVTHDRTDRFGKLDRKLDTEQAAGATLTSRDGAGPPRLVEPHPPHVPPREDLVVFVAREHEGLAHFDIPGAVALEDVPRSRIERDVEIAEAGRIVPVRGVGSPPPARWNGRRALLDLDRCKTSRGVWDDLE